VADSPVRSETLQLELHGIDSRLRALLVLFAARCTTHPDTADDRTATGDRQATGRDDEAVDLRTE